MYLLRVEGDEFLLIDVVDKEKKKRMIENQGYVKILDNQEWNDDNIISFKEDDFTQCTNAEAEVVRELLGLPLAMRIRVVTE